MKKKIIILALVIVLLCSTSIQANAAFPGASPLASSNGCTTGNVTFNGHSYDIYVGTSYSSTYGASVGCNTDWNCVRKHSAVTLKYLSDGDGILSVTGSPKSYDQDTGTSKSYYVRPYSNKAVLKKVYKITGSVTVYAYNSAGNKISKTLNVSFSNQ